MRDILHIPNYEFKNGGDPGLAVTHKTKAQMN
jgi:hypothetical protein